MLLSGGKMLHLMLAKMSDPETINAVLQGMDTLPETSMNMIQQGVNSYVEMQKQWTEQISRIGRHTEAYKFEGIDENVFKTWKETYEKEFQKFFNVPALGLTRFYQERINRLMDETSQFQVALSEFLYLFSVPFEKTAKVMQEKTEEMMEKGDDPERLQGVLQHVHQDPRRPLHDPAPVPGIHPASCPIPSTPS